MSYKGFAQIGAAFLTATIGRAHDIKVSSLAEGRNGNETSSVFNAAASGSGEIPNAARDSIMADKDLGVIPIVGQIYQQLAGKDAPNINDINPKGASSGLSQEQINLATANSGRIAREQQAAAAARLK